MHCRNVINQVKSFRVSYPYTYLSTILSIYHHPTYHSIPLFTKCVYTKNKSTSSQQFIRHSDTDLLHDGLIFNSAVLVSKLLSLQQLSVRKLPRESVIRPDELITDSKMVKKKQLTNNKKKYLTVDLQELPFDGS